MIGAGPQGCATGVPAGEAVDGERERLEALRSAEAHAIERRDQLETLRRREAELRSRLEILRGLRGGATAREMLATVVSRANDCFY